MFDGDLYILILDVPEGVIICFSMIFRERGLLFVRGFFLLWFTAAPRSRLL